MTAEVLVYGVVAARDDVRGAARARAASCTATSPPSSRDVGEARERSASRALREHWADPRGDRAGDDGAARSGSAPRWRGDDAVVDEFLAPDHDGLRDALAALDGKVQLTVKGSYDEDALLRGVVERSPAIARLRAQVEQLPEAASYAKRIQLGELVPAEVERERERATARS